MMMHRSLLFRERVGPLFARILRTAGAIAGEAYLVGGSVRDLLLERALSDLDIVIVGDARAIAAKLAAEFGGRLGPQSAFGTVALFLDETIRIDLATARSETYSRPAALPTVRPSGLEADLRRRDFSVNSMALDLRPASYGDLIDPTGGLLDLGRKRIRVLHDLAFVDDPTRIFRAVRYASRLGFEMTGRSARLMESALGEELVQKLSAARLGREVERSLAEEGLYDVVKRMRDHGLWRSIDGRFKIKAADLRRLRRIERMPWDRSMAALAMLTADWEPDELQGLARRLDLNRVKTAKLARAMAEARAIIRSLAPGNRLTPGRVYSACSGTLEPSLLAAMALSGSQKTIAALASYMEIWRYASCDINGSDLIAAGIPQGPAVAAGLRAAVAAKLNGTAGGKKRQLEVALRAARSA